MVGVSFHPIQFLFSNTTDNVYYRLRKPEDLKAIGIATAHRKAILDKMRTEQQLVRVDAYVFSSKLNFSNIRFYVMTSITLVCGQLKRNFPIWLALLIQVFCNFFENFCLMKSIAQFVRFI